LTKKQRKAAAREAKHAPGGGEGVKNPPTGASNNNPHNGKQKGENGNNQSTDATPKLSKKQRKGAVREVKGDGGQGKPGGTQSAADESKPEDGKGKPESLQ
jgi:hypothetical protein